MRGIITNKKLLTKNSNNNEKSIFTIMFVA